MSKVWNCSNSDHRGSQDHVVPQSHGVNPLLKLRHTSPVGQRAKTECEVYFTDSGPVNPYGDGVLGTELRNARLKAGMTQEAVAIKARLTREFISQVERGVSSPSVDNLLRICRAMKVQAGPIISRVQKRNCS
jgi:DNA-binding XRE family transcriptional regulator